MTSQLEYFLPSRLLAGLLPAALLEDAYDLYQANTEDPSEAIIRGYPRQRANTTSTALGKDESEARVRSEAETRSFRLFPQTLERYEHMLEIELVRCEEHLDACRRLYAPNHVVDGARHFARVTRVAASGGRLLLLSLLYARPGSQIESLARVLARVEPLSHVLAWCTPPEAHKPPPGARHPKEAAPYTMVLVELPRLKLTFKARWLESEQEWRLYSEDHAGLYLPDAQSEIEEELPARSLTDNLVHPLLLRSALGEFTVLLPNVKPVRPKVKNLPFTREVVLVRGKHDKRWAKQVEPPTEPGALMLLGSPARLSLLL